MAIVTPKNDGTTTVTLQADLTYRSGEFTSGTYRIGTLDGRLAGDASGDGIFVQDASELVSGSTATLKIAGQTFVRVDAALSGGQNFKATANGTAVLAALPASGEKVVGKILGPSTQVYASGTLAPCSITPYVN